MSFFTASALLHFAVLLQQCESCWNHNWAVQCQISHSGTLYLHLGTSARIKRLSGNPLFDTVSLSQSRLIHVFLRATYPSGMTTYHMLFAAAFSSNWPYAVESPLSKTQVDDVIRYLNVSSR